MVIRRLLGVRIDADKYRPAEAISASASSDGGGQPYAAEAYSLNFRKDTPKAATTFTVGGAAPAAVRAVLEAVERTPASQSDVAAIQAAIWAVTDDVSWEELAERGYKPDQQIVRRILESASAEAACTRLTGTTSACTPTAKTPPAAPAGLAGSVPGPEAPRDIRASLTTLYEANGSPLAWAPDGKTIYIGGSLTLYDVAARKATPIQGVTARGLSVSPDGKLLALAIYDGVQIWDITSRSMVRRLAGSGNSEAAAFSPDGTRLVTATGGAIKIWEVATGRELRTIPVGDSPGAIAFSRDGRTVATGGSGDIKLWDVLSGQQIGLLKGHNSWVRSLAFSSDGRLLASGSVDQSARLWNIETGQQLRVFTGHTGQVGSVSFSPDGRMLASASGDLTVKLWDTASGTEMQSLTGHSSGVGSVAFSPDGTLLASGSSDGLRLWRIEAGGAPKPSALLTEVGPLITPIPLTQSAITPGNIADLKQLSSLKSDRGGRVIWSPDGKLLAVGAYRMAIYEAKTLKKLYTMDGQQTGNSNAFSPDSALLASAAYEGVRLWDTIGWGELRTLAGSKDTHSLAFRPDGKLLATGTGSTVKLWEIASGQELRTLPSRRGDVQVVAFSPDGKTLAAGRGRSCCMMRSKQ